MEKVTNLVAAALLTGNIQFLPDFGVCHGSCAERIAFLTLFTPSGQRLDGAHASKVKQVRTDRR